MLFIDYIFSFSLDLTKDKSIINIYHEDFNSSDRNPFTIELEDFKYIDTVNSLRFYNKETGKIKSFYSFSYFNKTKYYFYQITVRLDDNNQPYLVEFLKSEDSMLTQVVDANIFYDINSDMARVEFFLGDSFKGTVFLKMDTEPVPVNLIKYSIDNIEFLDKDKKYSMIFSIFQNKNLSMIRPNKIIISKSDEERNFTIFYNEDKSNFSKVSFSRVFIDVNQNWILDNNEYYCDVKIEKYSDEANELIIPVFENWRINTYGVNPPLSYEKNN